MMPRQSQTLRARIVTYLNAAALAGCSIAHASGEQAAPGVFAVSSGRFTSVVATLIGLSGVVMGARALRSRERATVHGLRRGSIGATIAGSVGVALGAIVVANAAGGVGTGHGVAGAIVAVVLGGLALVLGGLALVRPRSKACSAGRDSA